MNPQPIQGGYYEITDMYDESGKYENTFKNFISINNLTPINLQEFGQDNDVNVFDIKDKNNDNFQFGLYLRDNNLNNDDMENYLPFPINLHEIDIEDNNFSSLPPLPDYLFRLNIRHNEFTELPKLSTGFGDDGAGDAGGSITYLYCDNNKISSIILPDISSVQLEYITCSFNGLEKLENLPSSLVGLKVNNNNLTKLPDLEDLDDLEELNCSNNSITKIPDLPPNLTKLDCANNSLKTLPDFPESLRVLSCRGNKFEEETVSRIIEFYEKAIKNNYTMTNPSFQEEIDYFNTNRTITAHMVLSNNELPHDTRKAIIEGYAGLTPSKGGNKTFLKKKTSKKKKKTNKRQTKNKKTNKKQTKKKKTMKKRQRKL
jgi:Leucine-rich repeat (LRR) protein